jgi:hypothetical protein
MALRGAARRGTIGATLHLPPTVVSSAQVCARAVVAAADAFLPNELAARRVLERHVRWPTARLVADATPVDVQLAERSRRSREDPVLTRGLQERARLRKALRLQVHGAVANLEAGILERHARPVRRARQRPH